MNGSISALHKPAHWYTRSGTWDAEIFEAVAIKNEYGLPDFFDPTDVILDVGAHCGAFSWACLSRGAGLVLACEVEPRNFSILRRNLALFGCSVVTYNAAVWRSDTCERLFYSVFSDPSNTGAGHVLGDSGQPVAHVIGFDDLITEALSTSQNGRIRLAKLDVEGSEFPILYTAKTLNMVDEIVGEYHEQDLHLSRRFRLPAFSLDELSRCLSRHGFSVTSRETSPGIGLFRATRMPTLPIAMNGEQDDAQELCGLSGTPYGTAHELMNGRAWPSKNNSQREKSTHD